MYANNLRFARSDDAVGMRAEQELCASARWRENPAGCDRVLLLRVFDGARAQTPARGRRLRAPVRSPDRAAGRPARTSPAKPIPVVSAPALEERSAPMRRKIFFDLAAYALLGSGAHDRGGHFREAGSAIDNRGIARTERQLAVEFRDGSAIPRGLLPDRWKGAFSFASARSPGVLA